MFLFPKFISYEQNIKHQKRNGKEFGSKIEKHHDIAGQRRTASIIPGQFVSNKIKILKVIAQPEIQVGQPKRNKKRQSGNNIP